MKLEEFVEVIVKNVSEALGEEYSVTSRKALKNNSVELDCLVVSQDKCNIAPNIYLNGFYMDYQNGKSIEDLTDSIIAVFRNCEEHLKDKECSFLDRENAAERVVLRLINYAKNRRILEKCPHERIKDLAVVYHYIVSNDAKEGIATVRIEYENMGFFNLDMDTIRQNALKNTERLFPPTFEKLEHILRGFLERRFGMKEFYEPNVLDAIPMYVLTSSAGVNGASCILYKGILERIRKSLNSDFYIIPSSINEVLIVPDSQNMDREQLNEMLRSVNREEVPEMEILSDNVYHYPDDQFVSEDEASSS
jgi:hypothetical protein